MEFFYTVLACSRSEFLLFLSEKYLKVWIFFNANVETTLKTILLVFIAK